jgi:hyperosmotically inducible periplasmic protein
MKNRDINKEKVMNLIRNLFVLTLAFFTLSVTGAQAQNYKGSAASSAMEKKIFKEIIKLPYYGVFDHIAFQINGSSVVLTGEVNNAMNRRDAEQAISKVEGVGSIVNNIRVLPPSPFDNGIRRQLLQSFASKGLYRYLWEPKPSVRIIVDGGRVALEGYVANRGDYNLMNILANSVPGVFSVQNNLLIEKELVH